MLGLGDVRDYIATLGVANEVYCGKMPDKQDKTIGVYPMKPNAGKERIGISSYGTKAISILVHWNKYPVEAEAAAARLYEKIEKTRNVTINGHKIKFISISYDDPVPVGTDDNGIFEYVIECLVYYDKEE